MNKLSDEIRRVRCNQCMSEFDEEHIKVIPLRHNDQAECCPICGEEGCLMDIDAQAKTMEQIALTKLEDCKVDIARVKKFMADYKIDTDRDMIDIFEAKLAGFLAAGGTIKDGE